MLTYGSVLLIELQPDRLMKELSIDIFLKKVLPKLLENVVLNPFLNKSVSIRIKSLENIGLVEVARFRGPLDHPI